VSRFTRKRLRLELQTARAALYETGRGGSSRCLGQLEVAIEEPLPELCSRLPQASWWPRAPEKIAIDVVLADRHTPLYLTEPPSNAQRIGDLRAVALHRLEQLFGVAADQHLLGADWRVDRAFLCCAMRVDDLAGLRGLSGSRQIRIDSIKPQFIALGAAILRQQPPAAFWMISMDGAQVTTAIVEDHQFKVLTQMEWPTLGAPLWDSLGTYVAREAALLGYSPPERVYFTCPDVALVRSGRVGATRFDALRLA